MVAKVYKFFSDTCAPCKVLSSKLQETKSKELIEEVDILERADLVQKFKIRKVPTLVFTDQEGEILFSSVGVVSSAEFEKLIEDLNNGSGEVGV